MARKIGSKDLVGTTFASSQIYQFLEGKKLKYETIDCAANNFIELSKKLQVPLFNFAKGVLLEDSEGMLLIVASVGNFIDYPHMCNLLCRDLHFTTPKSLDIFYDKALDCYAPFPEVLQVKTLIDDSFNKHCANGDIYLPIGEKDKLIKLPYQEFCEIQRISWKISLGFPVQEINNDKKIVKLDSCFNTKRMQQRIEETFELPVIPPIVEQLLKLRTVKLADTKKLVAIIEQDPSLSAQLISWSSSPYYGYPGKITSVEDAVIKVLGYDLVMNISLGIAVGQTLHMPIAGILGLKNYWRHALYCATLIDLLLKLNKSGVYRGMAYLSGLLHSIGFLLLGQVFRPQFIALEETSRINPYVRLSEVEKFLFNIDHKELGVMLMKSWHMPEELQIAVKYQNVLYTGKHFEYANFVSIANYLLFNKGVFLEKESCVDDQMFINANITSADAKACLVKFWKTKQELDGLVNLLAG